MVNLSGMANLKILSLGRNKVRNKRMYRHRQLTSVWQIKKLEQLDAISDRLEQLWISYNLLSNLAGVESCSKLRCLYAGSNNSSDPRELSRLQVLNLCKTQC